ncbi:hypothetical protein C7S18_13920 [Ahniella affigens]|uniref:Uncharacterized protein n=1 Tax=Ahniella affigens TaxID=2021234 RepID=A0A2P1PTR3_9GAMM|nr:hypothetical protein C7S18_13920 [Ahniella affigens]
MILVQVADPAMESPMDLNHWQVRQNGSSDQLDLPRKVLSRLVLNAMNERRRTNSAIAAP